MNIVFMKGALRGVRENVIVQVLDWDVIDSTHGVVKPF